MVLTISNVKKLYEITEKFEGFSSFPKKDINGKEVIGIGHNFVNPISHRVAQVILEEDIDQHIHELNNNYPWIAALNEARIIILIYMHFNLGAMKFSNFINMLNAAKYGNWIECAKEIRNSDAYKQCTNAYETLAHWMEIGNIE